MLSRKWCKRSFLLTKRCVGQKPRYNHPGPAHPHGDGPTADDEGPAEEEAQGVEEGDDQEEGSGGEVEGALGHEELIITPEAG